MGCFVLSLEDVPISAWFQFIKKSEIFFLELYLGGYVARDHGLVRPKAYSTLHCDERDLHHYPSELQQVFPIDNKLKLWEREEIRDYKTWSSFMLVDFRDEGRRSVLLLHIFPVDSAEERMRLDLVHASAASSKTVIGLRMRARLTVFWSNLMMMSFASSLKFSSNSGAEFWMAYSMLGRSLFMKGERPESISYMQMP